MRQSYKVEPNMYPKYSSNLLVIGAPKCGTSSLVDWLLKSSDICLEGQEKELFYLLDDDSYLNYLKRPLVRNNSPERYRLDGTVHYIYQEKSLRYFQENSDVRAVFIYRDPVERLVSAFSFIKYSHSSMKKNYSLDLFCEDLLKGNEKSIRNNVSEKHVESALNELQYGLYFRFLKEWAGCGDRLKVVRFQDLKTNPELVVKDIYAWLDLRYDDIDSDFQVSNESYQARSDILNLLTKYIGSIFPMLRSSRFLRSVYMNINSKNHNKELMSPEIRSMLYEFYQDDSSDLEELILKDLV